MHATLASGLLEEDLDRCSAAVQAVLDQIGPIAVRLKGPWDTRKYRRIYFR